MLSCELILEILLHPKAVCDVCNGRKSEKTDMPQLLEFMYVCITFIFGQQNVRDTKEYIKATAKNRKQQQTVYVKAHNFHL